MGDVPFPPPSPWTSLASWTARLRRLATGACPSCGAPAGAPLCPLCRVASRIPDGGRLHCTVVHGNLRLVHLGCYWCASPRNARQREPTPLAHALQRFKFGGDRYAGHCLARLFAEAVSDWAAQPAGGGSPYVAIVPIPLAAGALRRRRFNQSAWLARRLARHAGVAYRPGWLRRHGHRDPQHSLGAAARRANMRGVFSTARLPRPPGRVLVVDDVCTTGSTLAEAVRVLVNAGAAAVDAAVLILAEAERDGR